MSPSNETAAWSPRDVAVAVFAIVFGLFLPLLFLSAGINAAEPFLTGEVNLWNSGASLFLLALMTLGPVGAILLTVDYFARQYSIGGMEIDSALEELRRAYARGDVDDEEFERRRERLRED